MKYIRLFPFLLSMILFSFGCNTSDPSVFSLTTESETASLVSLKPALAPPDTIDILFGNSHTDDSASRIAQDKMVPGTGVVGVGGTVKFFVDGFHQVAVYYPGVKPGDITPSDRRVSDPTNRYFLGDLQEDAHVTFKEPGRYLVICNITSHFLNNMIGWVNVIGGNE